MTYDELLIDLARYSGSSVGFVYWAFPWGEPGGELRNASGPEPWQLEILRRLDAGLLSVGQAVQLAIASGHGVGKSALVAWIILWAISTSTDTRGVVTANTETQLKTKTWVELATWFRRFIAKDLFRMSATRLCSRDPDHEETWRIDLVPWSERNTEAFAGLHNQGRRLLVVMDEASAIPDTIHEVTEGALTDADAQIIWLMCGNPTRNKGRFRDAFPGGRFAHRWRTLRVDSREVSFTNKVQIQAWIDDYGEDSDFVRIRVKGTFPRVDAESFIDMITATTAVDRTVVPLLTDAIIVGVDVGRFGDDPSVLYPRRGRDGNFYKPVLLQGYDTMQTAAKVSQVYAELSADLCMVDGGGVGGGVVDRLRQLRVPVYEVQFGANPDGTNLYNPMAKYRNKRSEIWGEMRDWLKEGAIPDFKIPQLNGDILTLVEELTGPTYGLNDQEEIQLERKRDMRRRGVPSPNVADALACTFAIPVAGKRRPDDFLDTSSKPNQYDDYDPYDYERIYGHASA